MNTKSTSLIALMVLLLVAAPIGLQAEPAKEKAEYKVSVRVFNHAELQSLFHNICSPTNSGLKIDAPTAEKMLAGFSNVIEECSTSCCARCTRCANTGEQDDCSYCDLNCNKEAE